jgi:hypothetical protein
VALAGHAQILVVALTAECANSFQDSPAPKISSLPEHLRMLHANVNQLLGPLHFERTFVNSRHLCQHECFHVVSNL